MTNQQGFQNIIEQLRMDTDPVTATLPRHPVWRPLGRLDDNNLFEINFLGIAGLGYGAADAVAKWIENAQRTNAVDTAA
jgi:hypothetical protein